MEDQSTLNTPGPSRATSDKDPRLSQRKRKRAHHRAIMTSSSSSSDEDQPIDKSLQAKAIKRQLTNKNVKSIIKRVVQNQCVLAAVQQRAQDMDRQLEEEKARVKEQILNGSPTGRTMTRNRARELNQAPLKINDLNAVSPDKFISQLIASDLKVDDDDTEGDAEYHPNPEEESDDYSTATCSDVESQPRTPCEVATQSENEELDIVYDVDEGVFKMPQGLPIPKTPGRKDEISKRTRSKISLESKPIEVIQQPFNPPDVPPPDVMDTDCEWDADAPWLEFLEDFQKPMAPNEAEEGDETDPEYVFTDDGKVDELDSLVVPKREADMVLKELLDEIEENFNKSLQQEVQIDFSEPFPLPPITCPQPSVAIKELKSSQVDKTHSEPVNNLPEAEDEQPEHYLLPPADGVDPMGIVVPYPCLPVTFSLIQGSDQNLYLLPTLVPADVQPKPKSAFLEINVNDDMSTIVAQINNQRLANYHHMSLETTGLDGWTFKRLRMFHRQLLAFVQLTGQLFLQTFSHPTLWNQAKEHIQLLENFVKNSQSSFIIRELSWNLQDMYKICLRWEEDLNVLSEENQQYVRELVEGKLHPRVMERYVTHKAFIYPEYLPRRAAKDGRGWPNDKGQAKFILFALHLKENNCRTNQGTHYKDCMRTFREKYGLQPGVSYGHYFKEKSVLREYIATGKVPEIERKECLLESYDDAVALNGLPVKTFHDEWFKFLETRKLWGDNDVPKKVIKDVTHVKKQEAPKPAAPNPTNVTVMYPDFQAQFQLPAGPIYYGVGDSIPISDGEDDVESLADEEKDEGVVLDSSNEQVEAGVNAGAMNQKKTVKKAGLVKMIKAALNRQKEKQSKKSDGLHKMRMMKKLTRRFDALLHRFNREYDENMEIMESSLISTKLFNYFKEFDTFVRLFFMRSKAGPLGATGEPMLDNMEEYYIRPQDDELPSAPNPADGVTKEKDRFFAWRFVYAVRRQLKKDDFALFLNVLKSIEKDSLPELYLRLEELLSADFPELLKKLLVYLLPNHVAQVGMFMHEMISQDATVFNENLKQYIEQRQLQLDQIYMQLNYLTEDPQTEMGAIKDKFMAVVRGNPLMRDWFLQLFPVERSSSPNDCGFLQFWWQCNQIYLPKDLLSLLDHTELPPMNLFLSETEESDDDDIECTGVETPKPIEYATISVHSQETEEDEEVDNTSFCGIEPNEVMPHVSRKDKTVESSLDASGIFTECGSDIDDEKTDFTE